MLNPKNEKDHEICKQLVYIDRLEINVAFPFLLKVYDDYTKDIIDKKTFIELLEFIQSYTWRRFIVGLPTNSLNKTFMSLYDKVDLSNYLKSVQRTLLSKSGSQRFPRNSEVMDALKNKDIYNIKAKNRMYFFERLENYNNKEIVKIEDNSDITIEHIFPQNPDQKWRMEIGNQDYNLLKNNYLNTIANLTLSGNNGKLGNKTFKEKRDLKEAGYRDSRLWLNKFLSEIDNWGKKELEERFEILSERFFQIWDIPEIEENSVLLNGEVNIFEADDPKHKKLEYAIFFDQKFEINQVSKLYAEIFKQLFDLQPETFFKTDLSERLSLCKINYAKDLRQPLLINENYCIEGNIDNIGKFDRIKYALTLFDLEDELIIKYKESTDQDD